jgi:NADH-ubiquinone oxidoreductase chain 1
MTEHAAVIFVFFFLAEYASIVLICILNAILFLGGYLLDYTILFYLFDALNGVLFFMPMEEQLESLDSPLLEGMLYGLTIGIKSCIMIFVFI